MYSRQQKNESTVLNCYINRLILFCCPLTSIHNFIPLFTQVLYYLTEASGVLHPVAPLDESACVCIVLYFTIFPRIHSPLSSNKYISLPTIIIIFFVSLPDVKHNENINKTGKLQTSKLNTTNTNS